MTLGFNSFFTQSITCATLFSRAACSLSLDYNKTSLLYLANYSIMLHHPSTIIFFAHKNYKYNYVSSGSITTQQSRTDQGHEHFA